MKQRIISGVIGALGVLLLLIFRTTVVFNIVIAAASVLAMYEALVCTKIVRSLGLVIVSFMYAAVTPFIVILGFRPWYVLLTVCYVFLVLIIMLAQNHRIMLREVTYTFMMTFIISFAFLALMYNSALPELYPERMYLQLDGLFFVLISLGGAWLGDVGAYFIGVRHGKHKISPRISPKKTLEGLIGGVLFTLIFFLLMSIIWQYGVLGSQGRMQIGWMVFLGLVCPIVGLLGDLTFSYIKRSCNLKDFGDLIPGHGGLLDRIDSLIFVAPLIYVLTMFVPIIVR